MIEEEEDGRGRERHERRSGRKIYEGGGEIEEWNRSMVTIGGREDGRSREVERLRAEGWKKEREREAQEEWEEAMRGRRKRRKVAEDRSMRTVGGREDRRNTGEDT